MLCPRCNAKNDDENDFCGNCGRQFNSKATGILSENAPTHLRTQPANTPTFYSNRTVQAKPKRRRTTLFVALLLLLVIALVLAQYLSSSHGSNQSNATSQNTPATQATAHATVSNRLTPTHTVSTPHPTTTVLQERILYQAGGDQGWNGWNGPPAWKVLNGLLLNDGSNRESSAPGPSLITPYTVGTPDYAIEVKMRFVSCDQNNPSASILFNIRIAAPTHDDGYQAQIDCVTPQAYINDFNQKYITNASFSPGAGWHTYRFEAQGNTIRLLVDGGILLQMTDNQYLSGGITGMDDSSAQVEIASFKIIAL